MDGWALGSGRMCLKVMCEGCLRRNGEGDGREEWGIMKIE